MTDDLDDIFRMFDDLFTKMVKDAGFSEVGIFPWTNTRSYTREKNLVRTSTGMSTKEEIFHTDVDVTIVLQMEYGYNDKNIEVSVLESNGRRILQVLSDDNRLKRLYGLTDDMTGEFESTIRNGVLEIKLPKETEVVELGRESEEDKG